MHTIHARTRRPATLSLLALIATCALSLAASRGPLSAATTLAAVAPPSTASPAPAPAAPNPGSSLENAASKAGETGRTVAMSLIGLGFAVAAIVLSFRRDFKEAAGIFAVGIVAVLLATPAGVNLLRDTVSSLFGSQ